MVVQVLHEHIVVHSDVFILEICVVKVLKLFFVLLKILKLFNVENYLIVLVFSDALIVVHEYSYHSVEECISNLVDQLGGQFFVLAVATSCFPTTSSPRVVLNFIM